MKIAINASYLEKLLSVSFGHEVEIMRGSAELLGTKKDMFQVMPMDTETRFWRNHLRTATQWHGTPMQAALAYAQAWREWAAVWGD